MIRAPGKTLRQRPDRRGLGLAGKHAALQFEVVETVAFAGRFGLLDYCLRRQRLQVALSKPGVVGVVFVAVVEVGAPAIADVKQVAEHRYRFALLAFA